MTQQGTVRQSTLLNVMNIASKLDETGFRLRPSPPLCQTPAL